MTQQNQLTREKLYGEKNIVSIMEALEPAQVTIDKFLQNVGWKEILKGNDYRPEIEESLMKEISFRMGAKVILKESVFIDAALVNLKIMADVLKGSEQFIDWRNMARIVEMDVPKVEIPITDRTDFRFDPAGQETRAPKMGGQIPTASLDATGESGLFRGEITIPRSWLRDANYPALEDTLESAGEAVAVTVEKDVNDFYIANLTQTDTRANLDGTPAIATSAMFTVIDDKIPTNKFIPDLALMHPTDAAHMRIDQSTSNFPWLNKMYNDKIDNTGPGKLKIDGTRGNVEVLILDADAATSATVIVVNKRKCVAVGLRQDLEIEDFIDIRDGVEGAVMSMHWVKELLSDLAGFKITAFRTP